MTTARLADLLKPCSAEDFLDHSYGTSYCHVPGSPGKFSDLMGWTRLNQILDAHPLDWLHPETDGSVNRNRLSLVRRGQAIPSASFFRDVPGPRGNPLRRLDPARLAQLLRDGASLIVDGIDELDEPVGALALRLEHTLHEPIRVNLYASWSATPALDRHWDTHDIFVLQVCGRKHWRVYAPRRRYPVGDDVQAAPPPVEEPVWDDMLEEGDLLYLPRGCWHSAAAVEGPSLHLTVGVYKRTGLDLVDWLRSQLRDNETFRRDLPRFASPAEQAEHLEQLRDELLARWDAALLDRFLRESDAAAMPRRPTLSLPWSATREVFPAQADAVVQLSTPRPPIVEPNEDGGAELSASGQRWNLTVGELAALRPLLDGQACCLAELCRPPGESLEREGVRALLVDLVRAGLVTVLDVEPEPERES